MWLFTYENFGKRFSESLPKISAILKIFSLHNMPQLSHYMPKVWQIYDASAMVSGGRTVKFGLVGHFGSRVISVVWQ